jgi:hypothetical protein
VYKVEKMREDGRLQCPRCNHLITVLKAKCSRVEDSTPEIGQLTVCDNCETYLEYRECKNGSLCLAIPSPSRMADFERLSAQPSNPSIPELIAYVTTHHRMPDYCHNELSHSRRLNVRVRAEESL